MKIRVIHRSVVNPKTGMVELMAARPKVYHVTHKYSDGRVRVTSGDTWEIKTSSKYLAEGCQYVTVA